MRYLIQFVDRSSLTVTQTEGEAVGEALCHGKSIVLRGSFINPKFISIVKPINKSWFNKDFVEDEERRELAGSKNMQFLPAPSHD